MRWQQIPHAVVNSLSLKGAPKGKVPYIVNEDGAYGDSDLIIAYLCQKYHVNPDQGLSAEQLAVARSVRYLCEEGLYRCMSYFRFVDDAGWEIIRTQSFVDFPAWVRPIAGYKIRKYVKMQLMQQGIARHSAQEVAQMGQADVGALSDLLGAKPFFFGDVMHLIDILVFSVVSNLIMPPFADAVSQCARATPNLVAHTQRVRLACYGDANTVKVAA